MKLKEMREILKESFGAEPLFSSIDGEREVWTSKNKLLVVENGALHQIHDISDMDEQSRREIIDSI